MSLQIPTPPLTRRRWFATVLAAIAMLALAEPTLAQHTLQRTLTVDKSGSADFTTIQAAINSLRIGSNPTNRITVLIYAGKYPESVTLNGTKENVDLVGVDRDAIIIAPTTGNGITITSGTEISRNNTIRNLTIQTTDGHGIEIVKGTGGALTPRNIIIEDCVIEADGTDVNGILGSDAEAVVVRGCRIQSISDDGVVVGNTWTVTSSSIFVDEDTTTPAVGLLCLGRSNLTVSRSTITSVDDPALNLDEGSSNCRIEYCILESHGVGGPSRGTIRLAGVSGVVFFACEIINDATTRSSGTDPPIIGVFQDSSGSVTDNVVFYGCDISVVGSAASISAIGVKHDLTKRLTLKNCTLHVSNLGDPEDSSVTATAYGIQSNGTVSSEGVLVSGGSIITSSAREREPDVFDIGPQDLVASGIQLMSGTRLSKWRGPVVSAERQRSVLQRTLPVSPSSIAAVLAATVLTTGEQEVTTGITDPDVYRAVTITGSLAGMTQDVYVIGTNFAGDVIAEKITLSGIVTVVGNKPFMTVTKIILPVKLQLIGTQTVSVGTSAKLGLQFPIGADTDVIQFGVKASAATSYTITSFTPSTAVDVDFATFTPPPITNGDSFEFVVLSSQ